jgi:hypothetical protein
VLLPQRLQREQPHRRRHVESSLQQHMERQPPALPPADESSGYRAISGDWIGLPPTPEPPPGSALPAGCEEALHAAVSEARDLELRIHEAQRQAHALRRARRPALPRLEPADRRVYLSEHVRGVMDVLSGALAPSQATPAVRQLCSGRSGRPVPCTHSTSKRCSAVPESPCTLSRGCSRRAGLDPGGRLALPGTRGAAARLGPDLAFLIEDAAGRVLPQLPAGCTQAGERLAQLRREVKKIVTRQSARLEQAMIKGRIWRLDDFRGILLAHPITGRLCQRLIFAGLDGDAHAVCTF